MSRLAALHPYLSLVPIREPCVSCRSDDAWQELRRQRRELTLMLGLIQVGCKLQRAMSYQEIDIAFRHLSLRENVDDVASYIEERQARAR